MAADDLAQAHDKIRAAVADGSAANFSRPDDGDEPAPYDDEESWSGRTVDGEWLADFLTSRDSEIHRRGVTIVGARIVGGLDLEAADLAYRLALFSCQLGPHPLVFLHASVGVLALNGTQCGGVDAIEATFDGTVLLGPGTHVRGEVTFHGARIGGTLDCSGAVLTNPGGMALDASLAGVSGSVFLERDFAATGQVSLAGATVGGEVGCDAGRFSNPDGRALTLSGARIGGRVVLRRGCTVEGELEVVGATISEVLSCKDARLRNPGGVAMSGDRLRVESGVLLSRCSVDGEVRLVGAVIGGEIDARDVRFSNPGGRTIRLDSAQVAGNVNLSGARSGGEIRMPRSSIGGMLDLDGSHLSNPDGLALDAAWCRIGGYVRFGGDLRVEGSVSFRHAEAGGLADDLSVWPEQIVVTGFHYTQLTGNRADRAWQRRAQWLRKQDRPSPDAYAYLASVYRSVGDEHSARKILMERHNALSSRWRRWILRLTIGHGYEPWRVLYFVVPIMLVMTLWFAQAKRDDLLVPTGSSDARASDCDSEYTCVQPAVLAVDTLVPLVDFGQRSRWAPDQSRDGGRGLAAATWLTSALGWVIASLVAASFTQVVRRE